MSQPTSAMFNQVERTYAQALVELAEEASLVPVIADEMTQLRDLVTAEPSIVTLLSGRTLSVQQRVAALHKAMGGKVSDMLLRFLRLLVERNRFDEFVRIASAFAVLVDQRHGMVEVRATVAAPLAPEVASSIEARVAQLTGRQARLVEEVDPAMIGGVMLRVGDELIDGSVATQVRLLKEQLIDTGRAAARARLATLVHD